MTGVRFSLRVFKNLHYYSQICQKSGSLAYSFSQWSTCWTHQRHLSKYLTNYNHSANGLFNASSGILLATPPGTVCLYNSVRHKSKKSQKKNTLGTPEEDEDEEIDPKDYSDYEDEIAEDANTAPGYKDVERVVQSFRFDVILTAGLDLTRIKVEDAFYNNKLRLNGEKLWKKSRAVKVGDILDLVLEENSGENTSTLMRTILKEIHQERTSTDKYKVGLRRWKRLIVPKTPAPRP